MVKTYGKLPAHTQLFLATIPSNIWCFNIFYIFHSNYSNNKMNYSEFSCWCRRCPLLYQQLVRIHLSIRMYAFLFIVCLSLSTPSLYIVSRSNHINFKYNQNKIFQFRMIETNHLETVFDKHTAFVLTMNALRLPFKISSILWLLLRDGTNYDDLQTHCSIIHDSMSLYAGGLLTWALISSIFR